MAGVLSLSGTLSAQLPAAANSSGCPVTLPLHKEDRAKLPGGNYGSESFSTGLWSDGRIVFTPGGPGSVAEDGSLGMKFPWFWTGGKGQLIIEGRRLDATAPPLRSIIPVYQGYGNGFQPSGLVFPTPGCWEVTGRVRESRLTFVTEVIQVGDGPRRGR